MNGGTDADRLSDILALHALKARYFNALDSKDWAAFRAVFADDLMFWRDAAPGRPSTDPVTTDADAFVASIRARHEHSITIHQGHNAEIAFTGARTATGVWSLFDWVDNPEHGHAWQGYGIYTDEYVLDQDRRWRIHRMRLARVRLVPMTASRKGEVERVNADWQAGTLVLDAAREDRA